MLPALQCFRLFLFVLVIFPLAARAGIPLPVPTAPKLSASAYLLVDIKSGHRIVAKDVDKKVEPASLTKLMTSYLVFKELVAGEVSLSDKVAISEKAWRMEGSRMFIREGTEVTLEALIKGMVIQSGNDASVAIAEHIGGSEEAFAELMNHQAMLLGMSATNYVNSTGLPHAEHYTTAEDLAILAIALIEEFPEYYAWYSIKEYTYGGITQSNRNRLLWKDAAVDGLKTGHTKSAGYCLVASAEKDKMRLVSVVLGTSSDKRRNQETQVLMNYGFRFFETRRLYKSGQSLAKERIWGGEKTEVSAGILSDLYLTIPKRQYKNLKAVTKISETLNAPLRKGQKIGRVEVMLNDKAIAQVDLVTLESAVEGGVMRQLSDWVEQLWK